MKKLLSILLSVCLVLAAVVLVPVAAGADSTYYLVGNFNGWSDSADYTLRSNSSFDGAEEYMITLDLHAADELKVKSSTTWYPDGDNNYRVSEDGRYNIYFRPNYDGGDGWHYNVIYAERTGPASQDKPTESDHSGDDPYTPSLILLGDADGNGSVNVYDASYILNGTTGSTGYPVYSTLSAGSDAVKIADVDSSGTVNVFDAALVLRYTTGDSAAIALGIGTKVAK